MARTIIDVNLYTRAARARLPHHRRPHWCTLRPGQLHLGYLKKQPDQPGFWTVRTYLGNVRTLPPGKRGGRNPYQVRRLGVADDYEDANGTTVLSFAQAQQAATLSPPEFRRRASAINEKFKQIAAGAWAAQCYLYRHYDCHGDLLYVGISLDFLKRQRTHLRIADWRHQICRIEIEPFATRAEALEAERSAIWDEYPKHNRADNDHSVHIARSNGAQAVLAAAKQKP
jgi:hypothetical protein